MAEDELQPASRIYLDSNGEPVAGQLREPSEPVQTIRVLDFLETTYLSGPAKNLIEFACRAAQPNRTGLSANIEIATFHRGDGSPSNDFTVACNRKGLKVHIVRERFAYDPATISSIRNLIDACHPDIVQTHSVKSHFLLLLTGAYRRHRWIAFHHGYTWTDIKVLFYNQLDRFSLPKSLKVVTVCQAFAPGLARIGVSRGRIAIRHNSVNRFFAASAEAVARLRHSLRIPLDAKVLLNVGRLSREKGQAELIKALAILRGKRSDRKLRLVLVGDGPDRKMLERMASAMGVSHEVIFASYQSDVTPYYTSADLVVLPSHTEGSPNVLLEAMAAGLPIVATGVGGVPELVSDTKAALLVKAHDAVALAQGIARVLDDQELRANLSAAAKKAAAAHSPETYCESMLELYRDCMKQESWQYGNSGNHKPEKPARTVQNRDLLTE
jgi:glycosyltransferase involved in cell wall biosynthesis